MKNLIIDAAAEKIFFKIIIENKSQTTDYSNSRENFDKFITLLQSFLRKNHVKINDIDNIFINQGPGKLSSIRSSIAVAKALKLSNNINIYGFNSGDIINKNYDNIIDLFDKGMLSKNLVKLLYTN